MHKNIFINQLEKINIIKNYKSFLEKIKKLIFYMIKIEKNSIIKLKIYCLNCVVEKNK